MNWTCEISAVVSSLLCRNASSARLFTILNDSISTIRLWIIIRKRYCKWSIETVNAQFSIYLLHRATCVYLSCKTEEFNVSISQFVANIKGDRVKAMDIILSNELLLMQQLNYYLTVHNPYRPIEGFLIDIKTRCSMVNPEKLRNSIDEFIERTMLTDACLLYAPSQLALAAILHAASKEQENLDSYVTGSLFNNARDKLSALIEAVRSEFCFLELLLMCLGYSNVFSIISRRDSIGCQSHWSAEKGSHRVFGEQTEKLPQSREQSG